MRKSNNQQGVLPSSPKIDPNTRLFRRLHGAVEVSIEKLELRIAKLLKEVNVLRELVAPKLRLPTELKLTKLETGIVEILAGAKGHTVSYDKLVVLLNKKQSQGKSSAGSLKVAIVQLRKKLKPFGVHIYTRWKLGYYIDFTALSKLKQVKRIET